MRNCITIHGVWMYPREAIPRMIGLVRSGLLDLAQFAVTEFPLARANEGVAHAAANGGPFRMTVLKPAQV
jgi:alcohol dehydrogenase